MKGATQRRLAGAGPMTAKRIERRELVARANKGIPAECHLNARQWQQAIFRLRQRGES